MKYEEFEKVIVTEIRDSLGEDFRVFTEIVQKCNDIERHGLTICTEKSNISPVIYLDIFFYRYKYCECNISEIVEEILDLYDKHVRKDTFDSNRLKDFSMVKNSICARLVNTELNRSLLENVPHKNILDLSIIYYIFLPQENGDVWNIPVLKDYLEVWDITEDALHDIAMDNIKNDGMLLNLGELVSMSGDEEAIAAAEDSGTLYVLTNRSRLQGAIQLLNQKMMKEVCELIGENFFVLPSSINEVILIPISHKYARARNLYDTVQHMNHVQLTPDQILSGHVYHYNYKSGDLQILI